MSSTEVLNSLFFVYTNHTKPCVKWETNNTYRLKTLICVVRILVTDGLLAVVSGEGNGKHIQNTFRSRTVAKASQT